AVFHCRARLVRCRARSGEARTALQKGVTAMSVSRRKFLAAGTFAAGLTVASRAPGAPKTRRLSMDELDRIAAEPVLRVDSLRAPVIVESVELFRNGREHFVRVRSRDGAEGLAFANAEKMGLGHPVFLHCVAPFLVGKDVRRWEEILWEL